MRHYELACLISPELSPEELNSFQERIISYIQEEKGILVKIDLPFKKKGEVLLFGLNFQLNPAAIETFKKNLKADNQIIRYLLITKKVIRAGEIAEKSPRFPKKIVKPKVGLKEIEKKLEEILGET